MCRHLAYLGPERSLASLLHEPPHSLEHQSHHSTMQRWVTMNADGWGVGWWDHGRSEIPARYRTERPMWTDSSFRPVADLVHAEAVIAAVRAATPGSPVVETGAAPFRAGPWLFSLNGYVSDFPGEAADRLRRRLSPARSAWLQGTTDSEVLFGLVLDAIDAGASPAEAVDAVASEVLAGSTGELNLLLCDGHRVVASTGGNTLFALHGTGLAEGGLLLSSEPLDDDPAWVQLPDRSVVVGARSGYDVAPLALEAGAA